MNLNSMGSVSKSRRKKNLTFTAALVGGNISVWGYFAPSGTEKPKVTDLTMDSTSCA